MRKSVFDNIRWGELTGWATALMGILKALNDAPLPESVKHYVVIGISVLGFIMGFFRNPKTLEWTSNSSATDGDYP